MHYWKKNSEYKDGETLFDLVEENKITDSGITTNKKYKNPVIAAAEKNNWIRDIKRKTLDVKNNIEQK